jgi:hypothetical protein
MATNTYVALRTTNVTSATSSVTLDVSGITGYTDLVIVGSVRATTAGFNNMNFPAVTFNGDSSSGLYSNVNGYERNGSALSVASGAQNGMNYGGIVSDASTSGIFSPYILQLLSYSNTSVFKTSLAKIGGVSNLTSRDALNWTVGCWKNTNAITTITFTPQSSGNFVAGSTFTVYGIANSNIGAPKAFGGTITQDATYTYHTFGASGTFTPQQSLTCDYLVVAGGGAGAGNHGGGGAGGLRSTVTATGGGGTLESALSLTAQAYTITVGAGGAGQTYNNRNSRTSGGNSSIIGGAVSITSTGGGFGGSDVTGPATGGSGGGGAAAVTTGANGTANQGRAGGNWFGGTGTDLQGGGGGGAGVAGSNGLTGGLGGQGGNGVAISALAIPTGTGVANYYAGGGAGAHQANAGGGIGGLGGGGNAGFPEGVSGSGVAMTGGGGAGSAGGSGTSGSGGSGVVIIRYAN